MANEKRDKLLKRFYGISGVVDEYKRGQADRIGNNAFMFLFYYLLVANVVAFMVAIKHPIYAFYGLLIGNILVLVVGICPYLIRTAKKTFVTTEELTPEEIKVAEKRIGFTGVFLAIYFGTVMHLGLGFFSWLAGDGFIAYINNGRHIVASALSGLFFGSIMSLFARSQIKKVSDQDD